MPFSHISCEQLQNAMANSEELLIVDIRDPASYAAGHIDGAIHIDNDNVQKFIAEQDHSKALVVCCYHGNSSQGAADYFNAQGFSNVSSLDGGFERWKTL